MAPPNHFAYEFFLPAFPQPGIELTVEFLLLEGPFKDVLPTEQCSQQIQNIFKKLPNIFNEWEGERRQREKW